MSILKIVLAEDHGLVRAGLRALIEKIPDAVVVAEAVDGREALKCVGEHLPHILILDVAMPNLNGIETARQVAKDHPSTRILMLSMHSSETYVLQALRAGASGYMIKDAATTELEFAIKGVARGEVYLSPAVSKQVVESLLRSDGEGESGTADIMSVLTDRQREVLQLIAEGNNTKEIAYKLGIGIKTVETHRAHLKERLGIHDVVGLTRFAIRAGIVQGEDAARDHPVPIL